MEQEESKSRFLFKNALKGLLWLAVILTAFVLAEDLILENFQKHIDTLRGSPVIMFTIGFFSELIFGIIPPVLFMSIWKQLMGIPLSSYVINLSIFFVISYCCGVIGFYIGRNFSRTAFYKGIEEKYLLQYNRQLRKYGVFLVIVGALTPIPFSGTCMLAGSVNISARTFMLVSLTRIFYFIVYGWVAWSFPSIFA